MISVRTPDGDKNIAEVSILAPSGDLIIGTISILTPDGDLTLWGGAGGGGGGGGDAFSVTLDPNPVTGAVAIPKPVNVTTQECTATPVNGTAPFTYAWVQTDASTGWSILSPDGQTTKFRADGVSPGDEPIATFQVTVTDARGRTAIASVTATAYNYGSLSV